MIERLERRSLLSYGMTVQSTPPPVVIAVSVAGTEWTSEFRTGLQNLGAGDAELGVGVGRPEAPPLSWTNVNQITVIFSADMVVEARHLRVFGANITEYPVTSVSYRVNPLNFNGIATWTLARPLGPDKVLIQLDAHPPDGVRMAGNPFDPPLLDGDRDGRPGGDFFCRFESLPGDFAGVRRVGAEHVRVLRESVGRSVDNVGESPNRYYSWSDVTADGRINVIDMSEVRRRVGTTLPYSEPTGVTAAQAVSPPRTRPVTRGLFCSQPVLA